MISYLKGRVRHKGNGFIILEVNNVGYQVFILPRLYDEAKLKQEVEFYTHQQVREDALNLYGFTTIVELELFELLLSISGIGPRSALGVLSIASVADIKNSIGRGDPALLTKVSGIGRKTAERVILELREKIDKLGIAQGPSGDSRLGSSDEIDALVALGYSLAQAREALKDVDADINNSGERIRQALKKLGR